jgi:hypothetical protein
MMSMKYDARAGWPGHLPVTVGVREWIEGIEGEWEWLVCLYCS